MVSVTRQMNGLSGGKIKIPGDNWKENNVNSGCSKHKLGDNILIIEKKKGTMFFLFPYYKLRIT